MTTPAISVNEAASKYWKYFVPFWLFYPVLVLTSHLRLDAYVAPVFQLGFLVLWIILAGLVSLRPLQKGAITSGQWLALTVAVRFLTWGCFVIAFSIVGLHPR